MLISAVQMFSTPLTCLWKKDCSLKESRHSLLALNWMALGVQATFAGVWRYCSRGWNIVDILSSLVSMWGVQQLEGQRSITL